MAKERISDPFDQTLLSIYDELGLEPTASADEISNRLTALNDEVAALPENKKAARMTEVQELIGIVKNRRRRLLTNVLILDRVDARTVRSRLKHLGDLERNPETLPPPSLAHVVVEGAITDLAEQDFQPMADIAPLLLRDEAIKKMLAELPPEREIQFEN